MTACLPLLWTYDRTDPGTPGRIQSRCGCGWVTETFEDNELNRDRLARRGRLHVAEKTEGRTAA